MDDVRTFFGKYADAPVFTGVFLLKFLILGAQWSDIIVVVALGLVWADTWIREHNQPPPPTAISPQEIEDIKKRLNSISVKMGFGTFN